MIAKVGHCNYKGSSYTLSIFFHTTVPHAKTIECHCYNQFKYLQSYSTTFVPHRFLPKAEVARFLCPFFKYRISNQTCFQHFGALFVFTMLSTFPSSIYHLKFLVDLDIVENLKRRFCLKLFQTTLSTNETLKNKWNK